MLKVSTNFSNNKSINFGSTSRIVKKNRKVSYRNTTAVFRNDLNWFYTINYIDDAIRPSKIKCYACSDGSEAYSTAMTVIGKMGMKMASKYFPIEAVDIDRNMIQMAQNRILPLTERDIRLIELYMGQGATAKYFSPLSIGSCKSKQAKSLFESGQEGEKVDLLNPDRFEFFKVKAPLAKCIDFSVGDIVTAAKKDDLRDTVVFCRNVWPYLSLNDLKSLVQSFKKKFTSHSALVIGDFDLNVSKTMPHGIIEFLKKNADMELVHPFIFKKRE